MAKLDTFCSVVNLARDSVPGGRSPIAVLAEETLSLARRCGSRGVDDALFDEEEAAGVLCCADLGVDEERPPLVWARRRPAALPFDEK